MAGVVDKVIEFFMGSKHEREMKRLQPRVDAINALEPEVLPHVRRRSCAPASRAIRDEVGAATADLPEEYVERRKLVQGVLDDHLEEVFAIVREAGRRALGMRHFDVQLIGGMVLHEGKIAEMRTGEGKTLVATLPVVPQRPHRPRRARRHRQRLPGQARRRVDGPDLQLPRPHRRRASRTRWTTPSASAAYARRHHLRHQQRVRLRLPARQHEVRPSPTWCSAATSTRSSTRSTRS